MANDYAALREQRLAKVDAETRAIYDATGSGFHIRRTGVEGFRKLFAEMVLAPVPRADGVLASTVAVPGPAGDIPTRVYMPADHEGPLGVYVHTHGGGWIAWNGLEGIDGPNSQIVADWGCAVVHPDFRVPPEDPFPAAIEDCWAVVEWVASECEGVDPERIAVGGGCTGGNIAAVMALMARDAGQPKIALQLLDSPQLDTRCDYRSFHEYGEGFGLGRDDDLFVVEQYLREPEDRWDWRASPILAESVRGVAPAIVTAGEYEILRDEARLYAGRLADAGVPVHYVEGPGQPHGFTSARNLETGEFTAAAASARAEIAALVRRYIGTPAAAAQASSAAP